MDRLISEKSVMEVIYGCDWFIDEEHVEVIKERIKAIPSVEPTLDSIRESIEEYTCNIETDTARAQKMLNAWRAIEYDEPLPTAEPKTGQWISHREHCENLGVMPSGLGAYEWCSNCDCGIDVREWHRNNYNFCPNCGVKMN